MDYKGIVNIIRDAATYVNASGTFLHGRKSDASLDFNGPAPYIFLLEPRPLPQSNNSKFVINISFPILFVTQDSPESSELEREDLKQDMSLLALRLLSKIDESDSIEQVRFESPEPEIRQMAGTLTGFSFNLLLTYNTSDCAIDIDLPPTIKIFASDTSVSVGQQIELAWISTNVNSVTITGLGVLQGATGVVNIIINAETTYTATATNNAGTANDSIKIEIETSCLDATAIVKNTLGNIIANESIPSGTTEDIIITDSTAVIKNTLGTTLKTEAIPAEVSENITINNTTVQLKDTANNNLGAVKSYLAESSNNATVANTNVQLKDSAGNNIGSLDSYLAESTNNKTAPDGNIVLKRVNTSTLRTVSVRSNQTKDETIANTTVALVDSLGNAISSNSYQAESANNLTAPDGTVTVRNTTPTTLATQAVRSNGAATVTLSDIVLTINDQNGNNLSTSNEKAAVNITKTITVSGALDLTIAASTTTPVTNQSITFTGGCTNGTPTNWRWDFGDGTSSTLQNPTKSYVYAGTYTVVLSATDGTLDGYVVFASTITVTLQALFSTNIQMHNRPLIGASPANATLVSGLVSQWNDSISNYNRTQGTVANRPTYLFPAITSPDGTQYGAVRYDGTNDFLNNATVGFTRATGSFEVLVFRNQSTATTTRVLIEAGIVGNLYEMYHLSVPLTFGMFNGTVRDNINCFQIGTWAVLFIHWNAGLSFMDWNNRSRKTALGDVGTGSSTGSTQGAAWNGAGAIQVDIAEHIIYTSKPSDADITSIMQRMTSQYGNIF
jgi:PKD repeat protein